MLIFCFQYCIRYFTPLHNFGTVILIKTIPTCVLLFPRLYSTIPTWHHNLSRCSHICITVSNTVFYNTNALLHFTHFVKDLPHTCAPVSNIVFDNTNVVYPTTTFGTFLIGAPTSAPVSPTPCSTTPMNHTTPPSWDSYFAKDHPNTHVSVSNTVFDAVYHIPTLGILLIDDPIYITFINIVFYNTNVLHHCTILAMGQLFC